MQAAEDKTPTSDSTALEAEQRSSSGGLRARLSQLLPTDSLRARFARGAFWSLVGAAASQGLGTLAEVFVARRLGKVAFGEIGMVESTVGMFGVFAGLGLGLTATKHVAEFRRIDPSRASRVIGLSTAVALLFSATVSLLIYGVSPYIASHVVNRPQLIPLLRIGSLILLFTSMNGAQTGILAGLEAFKSIAIVNVWRGIAGFVFLLAGVYFGGLTGAVWGMAATAAFGWLATHFALRHEIRRAGMEVSYRGAWAERSLLWKFSLPAVLSQAMFAPSDWAANAMFAARPGGYAELGIFNAARQWSNLILFLPGIISQISVPMLTNLWAESRRRSYRRLLWANAGLITAVAVCIAAPVAIAAPWAMRIYGPEFPASWRVLVVVCLYSVLWASNIVFGQALWSLGAARAAVVFAALRAVLLLVAARLFVGWGAFGLACAYTATYLLQTAYVCEFVRRLTTRLRVSADTASPGI